MVVHFRRDPHAHLTQTLNLLSGGRRVVPRNRFADHGKVSAMSVSMKVARAVRRGKLRPGLCPICGVTLFHERAPWLRDNLVCLRCRSIPRQRGIIQILKREAPKYRTARVFESSPDGPASDWLARNCSRYSPSQFFDDVPRGESTTDGVRSEDLQAMTLPDESVDIFVTQDVLEHILDPNAALREIARVLSPGGMHIFTVPIFPTATTLRRAEADSDGGIRHLVEPDYHGNPLGDGSLVIHEWGDDLVPRVEAVSGLRTTYYPVRSQLRGLRGLMLDVFVSRKPASAPKQKGLAPQKS